MPQKQKQRTGKCPQLKKKTPTALIHIARVAKLIRTVCCCSPIYMQPDRSRFNHLSKFIIRKCMSSDTLNSPVQRDALNEGIKAFEVNELDLECPLSAHLDIQYQISIDKKIEIFFPAFIPAAQITTSSNATHCKLIAVTVSLDFSYYTSVISSDESPLIPLTHNMVNPFSLKMELPQLSQKPVFLVIGLSYCDETKHSKYCQAVKFIQIKNADTIHIS